MFWTVFELSSIEEWLALENVLFFLASEEPTTKDTDRQILEAAKSGDMEILKVFGFKIFILGAFQIIYFIFSVGYVVKRGAVV